MWLLVGIVAITILSIYFSERLGEDHPLFNTFLFIIVCGFLLTPSLIIFEVLERYDVVQEYIIFPMILPLFLMAGFILWADRSKTKNSGSGNAADKKDMTAEAIIMTVVLSEDEKSDSSNNSNSSSSGSSGSSSSGSNSNSDDFFIF